MPSTIVNGVPTHHLKRKRRKDNTTGYKGVTTKKIQGYQYYQAYIQIKGKKVYGPNRRNFEDAVRDRQKRVEEYHLPYLESENDTQG